MKYITYSLNVTLDYNMSNYNNSARFRMCLYVQKYHNMMTYYDGDDDGLH